MLFKYRLCDFDMSDIGSEEFEEDEGINLGVSENNISLFCNRNLHTRLENVNNIASSLPVSISIGI